MADPICRWRNPYIKTVREFISELPKSEMKSTEFRLKMEESSYGTEFFRTPYQLACQLGLYYELDGKYFPRFKHNANISEVNSYLEYWLKKYKVPNPYTRQGFENIPPTGMHSKMCEMLYSSKNSIDWNTVKTEIFKEVIGNDDILVNTISTYSQVLQIKNNRLQLKEGAIYEDLIDYMLLDEPINRNNKEEFFNLFNSKITLPAKKAEEKEEDIVIEENSSIRDFALNVFNHFYSDKWSDFLESTKSKSAKLNTNNFTSHDLKPFVRLIAEFPTIQTKDNLSSAERLRFFETPIYQTEDRFFYFSTQWFGTGDESLSFQNLKSYFESLHPQYQFEKTDTTFKLIKKGTTLIPFDCKAFHQKTKDAGLKFSEKIVRRFVASLCTKPFVICSGLSGSGKTKLAQSFVQWICESGEQYKIVPVGADWTNREPLLGFPNGLDAESYIFPDSGVLQLILDAINSKNKDKPYFLILDEMNLSHVERYFADFLSIMESHDKIKLYSGETRGDLPNEISWPQNLFIIGTVNIDETTYMFSPKVLDRANVIEFRITEAEIKEYLDNPMPIEMEKFINQQNNQGNGAPMAVNFLNIAKTKAVSDISVKENLHLFFKELKKSGAEFGYRSASEINRLIAILDALTKDSKKWDGLDINTEDEFIDIAIMQKLLPKLHGSRNKLTKVLPILGGLCLNDGENIKEKYFDRTDPINYATDVNIKYKISFEKICRMYKNAIENGFASYAEA